MWLITPVGFFSVVQKASDIAADTLTVRARVRGDLDALREQYLPGLGEVQESKTNDYRLRAVAPRAEVAAAMASMVDQLQYSNFKSQVAKVQGTARAHLYHDVWDVLHRLQTEPAKYQAAPNPSKPAGQSFIRSWGNTASVSSSKSRASPVLWPLGLTRKPLPA